jgi:hypothetical protein
MRAVLVQAHAFSTTPRWVEPGGGGAPGEGELLVLLRLGDERATGRPMRADGHGGALALSRQVRRPTAARAATWQTTSLPYQPVLPRGRWAAASCHHRRGRRMRAAPTMRHLGSLRATTTSMIDLCARVGPSSTLDRGRHEPTSSRAHAPTAASLWTLSPPPPTTRCCRARRARPTLGVSAGIVAPRQRCPLPRRSHQRLNSSGRVSAAAQAADGARRGALRRRRARSRAAARRGAPEPSDERRHAPRPQPAAPAAPPAALARRERKRRGRAHRH